MLGFVANVVVMITLLISIQFKPSDITGSALEVHNAISTLAGVAPYISSAAALTGPGAGTGAGSIASYLSPYKSQVIDATLTEFDIQSVA